MLDALKSWWAKLPTLASQRRLALILLISQGAITVTGSIVRVTGSGLGCDGWPNCHPGSLVPVPGAAPIVQQFVEFGNRLLTFVLAAVALLVALSVHRARRRDEILIYAWISGLGIIAQAVIGGISVHLDLKWWAVALHFLPSMILVWVAALLFMRINEPDDARPARIFPHNIRVIALIAAIALAFVLVTGTMVTGSGPHSGDAGIGMEGRLEVNTRIMAYIHAFCMYCYLGLTVVTAFLLRRASAPQPAQRAVQVLIGLIVVQWAIGVAQFHLGVPRWTVPVHIGMSSVVTTFTAFLWVQGYRRPRETRAPHTHSVAGDRSLLKPLS
ncbi:COX15/CtaA family protein [Corynebacterium uterequi]|uniref:Cytochrome oxidase assembly protein n=1 Tax=Corynebacterium uterequi TaxID=1072256 RepID=A0A0G3HGY2_9CORY|nr:COX15/CtaA family protein [Corynebacterium uterequi]AKK11153.1 cytochrome oxidase assembly protein [Corynebacterium uterequi]